MWVRTPLNAYSELENLMNWTKMMWHYFIVWGFHSFATCSSRKDLMLSWWNFRTIKTGLGGVEAQMGQCSDTSQGPKLPPDGKKSSAVVVSSLILLVEFLLSFFNDCLCSICWKLCTDLSLVFHHIERMWVNFHYYTWVKVGISVKFVSHKDNRKKTKMTLLHSEVVHSFVRIILEQSPWRYVKILPKWQL